MLTVNFFKRCIIQAKKKLDLGASSLILLKTFKGARLESLCHYFDKVSNPLPPVSCFTMWYSNIYKATPTTPILVMITRIIQSKYIWVYWWFISFIYEVIPSYSTFGIYLWSILWQKMLSIQKYHQHDFSPYSSAQLMIFIH